MWWPPRLDLAKKPLVNSFVVNILPGRTKIEGEVGWDPMGGDPWEPKGIPWEGTHGRGNPWEAKGSHGRGPGHPMGGEPLGTQGRDPKGGDPWGPHWEFNSRYFVMKLLEKNAENHEHPVF